MIGNYSAMFSFRLEELWQLSDIPSYGTCCPGRWEASSHSRLDAASLQVGLDRDLGQMLIRLARHGY